MEKWDLYDKNRNITGEHIRGQKLPENGYHLVVHVWIKNSKGQFLISQRAANRKINPLMYECVGGSVLKGESSLEGALREVKEEVGINLNPQSGKIVFSKIRDFVDDKRFNDILDVWLFEYNDTVSLNRATTDEVAQVEWMYPQEIMDLHKQKKLVWTLSYFFDDIAYK